MTSSLNDYSVTIVNNLKLTLDNLVATVQNETAYWAANGPRPTYSLANRNVSWNEWLSAMMDNIAKLNEQIIKMDQPYELNTRYYT